MKSGLTMRPHLLVNSTRTNGWVGWERKGLPAMRRIESSAPCLPPYLEIPALTVDNSADVSGTWAMQRHHHFKGDATAVNFPSMTRRPKPSPVWHDRCVADGDFQFQYAGTSQILHPTATAGWRVSGTGDAPLQYGRPETEGNSKEYTQSNFGYMHSKSKDWCRDGQQQITAATSAQPPIKFGSSVAAVRRGG